MLINIKRSFRCLLLVAVLAGCSKQKGFVPKNESYSAPDIPVTVDNSADNRPNPTVTTALADGAIKITLSIPSSSGRTIKEISKIATNTSYVKIQSADTTGFYKVAPVPGNGTTVTFNTSIAEYFVNNPVSATNPAAKAGFELTLRYYFRLTLDDGKVLYPMPVQVLVL